MAVSLVIWWVQMEPTHQYNLNAEQKILANLLDTPPKICEITGILDPDDFYLPLNERIFRSMCKLYELHQYFDPITIGHDIKAEPEDEEILDALQDGFMGVGMTDEHIQIVRTHSRSRKMLVQIQTAAHMTVDEKKPDEALSSLNDEIEKLVKNIGGTTTKHIATDIDTLKQIVDGTASLKMRVPTGLDAIDTKVQGMPEGMCIVAARTSVGKTTLGLNIVSKAVKTRMPCAIFSFEMTREQLTKNLICVLSGMDAFSWTSGKFTYDDKAKFAQGIDDLRQSRVFISDCMKMTAGDVCAEIRALHARENIQFAMVDYLGLLTTGEDAENRQQEMSKISRMFTILGKDLGIPIMVISQLNRNSTTRPDKHPRLSDLRESGSLEQDADMVILLYRDLEDTSWNTQDAEIRVAKNRNGPVTSWIELTFVENCLQFKTKVFSIEESETRKSDGFYQST